MAIVVVGVLHIAVSVRPSVIDGPVGFIVRLNVLESILLSVWIIIFMTILGRVDSLSGEWLRGVAWIQVRFAFLLVRERVCSNWFVMQSLGWRIRHIVPIGWLVDSRFHKRLFLRIDVNDFFTVWGIWLIFISMRKPVLLSVRIIIFMTVVWGVNSAPYERFSWVFRVLLFIRLWLRLGFSFSVVRLNSWALSIWEIASMAVVWRIDSVSGIRSSWVAFILLDLSPRNIFWWRFGLSFSTLWLEAAFLRHKLVSIREVSWLFSSLIDVCWSEWAWNPLRIYFARHDLRHELVRIREISWLVATSIDVCWSEWFRNPLRALNEICAIVLVLDRWVVMIIYSVPRSVVVSIASLLSWAHKLFRLPSLNQSVLLRSQLRSQPIRVIHMDIPVHGSWHLSWLRPVKHSIELLLVLVVGRGARRT